METTKESIRDTEKAEDAYDSEYFTERSVYTGKRTWNEEHSEKGMCVGAVSMTPYIYLLIYNFLPYQNLGMDCSIQTGSLLSFSIMKLMVGLIPGVTTILSFRKYNLEGFF